MGNILVVYGTTEGHTRKIAQHVGAIIRTLGHDAEVVDSVDIREDLTLRVYDAFILMGSLHQGFHQRPLTHFVKSNREELGKAPSAFLSVSLTAAYPDGGHESELEHCAQTFFEHTGWHPTEWLPVAGALKYLEYDWIKRMILRSISKQAGGDTDTSRDYEYTDWAKLDDFIGRFLSRNVLSSQIGRS